LYSPVEKEDAKPKPASPYLSGNYKVPHPKLGLLIKKGLHHIVTIDSLRTGKVSHNPMVAF
jgi:hypothetical protein